MLLYTLFYILGAIITFGRMTAIDYQQIEEVIEETIIGEVEITPWYKHNPWYVLPIYLLGSWIAFAYLQVFYYEKKYFLKFNYKTLKR